MAEEGGAKGQLPPLFRKKGAKKQKIDPKRPCQPLARGSVGPRAPLGSRGVQYNNPYADYQVACGKIPHRAVRQSIFLFMLTFKGEMLPFLGYPSVLSLICRFCPLGRGSISCGCFVAGSFAVEYTFKEEMPPVFEERWKAKPKPAV